MGNQAAKALAKPKASRSSARTDNAVDPDTLLFVDVDGVLNVGVRDPPGNPLDLNEVNISNAQMMWESREGCAARNCIERIVSTCSRDLGHGEESTYAKFVSNPKSGFSPILVARLATLILKSGDRRFVVLSSTWRKPRHAERVLMLEAEIGRQIGQSFKFDAKTDLDEKPDPGSRLENIGDFISSYVADGKVSSSALRVIVFEDFHCHAMGSWTCSGNKMQTVAETEKYLTSRVPTINMSARVIHTYDEWTSSDGLGIQIGSGLTLEHFCRAQSFLGAKCDFCVAAGCDIVEQEPNSKPFVPSSRTSGIVLSFPRRNSGKKSS